MLLSDDGEMAMLEMLFHWITPIVVGGVAMGGVTAACVWRRVRRRIGRSYEMSLHEFRAYQRQQHGLRRDGSSL